MHFKPLFREVKYCGEKCQRNRPSQAPQPGA